MVARFALRLDFEFQSETAWASLQVISATAACGAGIMAAALSSFSVARQDNYLPAVAAALVAMGIVSGALAVRPIDGNYLALHALEPALGAIFISTAWLRHVPRSIIAGWRLTFVAALLAVGSALCVVHFQLGTPGFLDERGRYGDRYLLAFNLSALFFVVSGIGFLRAYVARQRLSDLVFCYFALVSGLSDIAWPGLFVWGPLWWTFQLLQTTAYGIVLVYLLYLHLFLERSLEESNQRFETLSGATFEGVLVLTDGRVTDWNKAFSRISGLSRNELRGLPLTNLLPPEVVAVLAESEKSCETELRGGERSVPVEVRSQQSGDTRFVVFRDLSERRNLEREVAATQARLNELFQHSTDGIAYAELDGKVLHANKAFSLLTGYSPETLAAGVAAVDVLRGGGRMITPAAIGYGREYEREYLKRDGSRICVMQTEYPVRNIDGRVTHVGILVKDVTESRASTETLHRLNEELTRSNSELDRFAAIASHDLAEPLRTIASALQLIEKNESTSLQPDSRKYLTYALSAARRLRGLTQGFLSYSRVQSHTRARKPVDCNASSARVLESVRTLIEESGATVHCEPLPTIFGDPELFELLLQNLIVNAVKYRRDVPPVVRLSAEHCGEGWEFAVADNGCGIGEEAQEKIFTLFARGPGRSDVAGDGIGLATCKKIVELFGGRIWVDSTPHVGSTFRFVLPKLPASAEAPAVNSAPNAVPRKEFPPAR